MTNAPPPPSPPSPTPTSLQSYQSVVFPPAQLVSSISQLTIEGSSTNGGDNLRKGATPIYAWVLFALLVCSSIYAMRKAYSFISSPASHFQKYNPNSNDNAGRGWRWGSSGGGGGGGARGKKLGGGFELTDIGRDQEQMHHSDELEIGDDFVVGGGRRGDREAGPGYASLLSGQQELSDGS